MGSMRKKLATLLLCMVALGGGCGAQKLIQYSAGMGSRDPENGDIWILFRGVTATHEGMRLRSDSAHFNTKENSFESFGNVVITLTDTTTIFGDRLFYDGNSRVADIWTDTVVLEDGQTQLLANHITYERNRATAYYTLWGQATSGMRLLMSNQGEYNSDLNEFFIYNDVYLSDTSMQLYTDTLIYNTVSEVAHFESPTRIYSDSTVIYSELGDYNTATRYAVSYRRSQVNNREQAINCDTLLYDQEHRYGKAMGNVIIFDSVNDITCTGRYGETSQSEKYSLVTDSALVLFVNDGDSLYLHADTIYLTTDSIDHLESVRASHHVKVFRGDGQAMCDSAYYSATDSLISLYGNPTLWYEHYQCTADTIELQHDSSGVKQAWLRTACFAIQQVDAEKFNQLKGRQGVVYFDQGEPQYTDIIGNAEMVFYITESDSSGNNSRLVGANAGVGSSIRIYFDTARAPQRVVATDNPDMKTYPPAKVPEEWRRLKDFRWLSARRPRTPMDVFEW